MPKNPAFDRPAVADLIGALGMTLKETAEFLTGRGYPASENVVKAWTRGAYNAPEYVYEVLWPILVAVYDDIDDQGPSDIPADAPEGVRRRANAILSLHRYWAELHPPGN